MELNPKNKQKLNQKWVSVEISNCCEKNVTVLRESNIENWWKGWVKKPRGYMDKQI